MTGPTRDNSPVGSDLEQALTAVAWRDPSAVEDGAAALAALGVDAPSGMRFDVRVQRRDTLYFVIPPAAEDGGDPDRVVDQMDLWGSGDQFVWILPQDAKVDLLDLRQQYRHAEDGGDT